MMKAKATVFWTLLKITLCLGGFSAGFFFNQGLSAAVTFTNTPTAVSNTFTGTISLQIGGLTNTETVVIQKFLDANTNGIIDGGDILWQQFNLTDGQANVFHNGATAVTNFNVPGDTDTTAGQITAPLNFQNGDFSQNIVGKYLYELSSPVGHFTPLTNLFNVTNFPYAQKFTGNVVSNGTSTTLPNAIVLVFPPPAPGNNGPGGSPLAGVVANNAGSYTVQLPPGTYSLMSFRSNYVVNMNTSPTLTLGSGSTITTNLTLTNATQSISGKIVDANTPTLGLPGLLVPMTSTNNFLAIGFTDTNGNFTVGTRPSVWKIESGGQSLIVHGYLALQNNIKTNTAGGSVSGITIALPKATAIFYGSVKDNLGNPMAGIDVYANDNNNQYQSDGYTDTNGNYVAGASAADWQVGVSSDSSPANYLFSQGFNTTLTNGQAVLQNFTAVLATNHITGYLTDAATGLGIANVGVPVWATISGVQYMQYARTDSNGFYSNNVANGSWSVNVNCHCGYDDCLGMAYQCPDNQSVTINNNNAVANFTVQPCGGVQILTTSLPDGQVGSYYDLVLQGSTCSDTLNWSLNDPQDFPSSLGWSGNGEIQGTPDSSGTYNFSVHLDDGNGNSTNQNLSLYIAGVSSPLQVTTTYLPNGTNGTFYAQTIQASGGQMPYSWSIPNYSADPPPNLTLATNGVLSGTLATTGIFYFDVEVTDGAANTAYQTLSVYIVNPPLPPLLITNVSLPNGTIGAAYSAQLGATGGQSPYNWQLAAGSANPPAGLTLYSGGLISGTPTTNKVSTFKVQATDANFGTTNKVLSITINSRPVLGLPTWLTNRFQMWLTGASNQNYTVQMSTNLSSTNWVSLFITNSATTNSFLLTDPNATNKQRFYRILIGQ
jgi:hypothetical protein